MRDFNEDFIVHVFEDGTILVTKVVKDKEAEEGVKRTYLSI